MSQDENTALDKIHLPFFNFLMLVVVLISVIVFHNLDFSSKETVPKETVPKEYPIYRVSSIGSYIVYYIDTDGSINELPGYVNSKRQYLYYKLSNDSNYHLVKTDIGFWNLYLPNNTGVES